MQEQLPEVSEIRELEHGYACRVNGGNVESAFIDGMDGRAGRVYAAIWQAIADGAEVEPYVPYVPTTIEKLAKTDAELLKIAARTVEDIIDDRIAAGKFVSQEVKDKIAERKALREEL